MLKSLILKLSLLILMIGSQAIERVNKVSFTYLPNDKGNYFVFNEQEMRDLEVIRQELEFYKEKRTCKTNNLGITGLYNGINGFSFGLTYFLF